MDIRDIRWLVNAGSDRRRVEAQVRRGGSYPDWVEEFLVSAAAKEGDPTINKSTGLRHTVESMVDELRERVRLDVITKEAAAPFVEALNELNLTRVEKQALLGALQSPPLSYCTAEADAVDAEDALARIEDYILRHHVRPARGHTPPEALYEAVKDQFGIHGVTDAGGREAVMELLRRLREENSEPNPADGLPTYDGSPIALRHDYDPKDRAMFMSSDTAGTPGSYM